MCSVLFLPVRSLITCFRSSLTCFANCVSLFCHYNSSLDVRLFYVSLRSQAPNSSTPCFPFLQCEGMATVTNWRLHMHYGITLWEYLSQMHRPNLWYCTVGIPFWTSHKRQSQTSKFNGKTTIPCAPSYVILLRTCIQKHWTWRKWLP